MRQNVSLLILLYLKIQGYFGTQKCNEVGDMHLFQDGD